MIQKNVSLQEFHTLKLPVFAEYFCEVKNETDLKEAVFFAKEKSLPVFVLGAGSNMVFFTKKVCGLVLLLQYQKTERISPDTLRLGAGNMLFPSLFPLEKEGYFITPFAGYPSSIGGAVIGNAGSASCGIGDFLVSAQVFSLASSQFELWDKEKFQFSYRSSALKERRDMIFWEGDFVFKKQKKTDVLTKEYLEKRKNSQPKGFSAGCFFKNSEEKSAGALIDEAGLKGVSVGGAFVSEIHANFLMNDGTATPEDFQKLIQYVQKTVLKKFGITLELEVKVIK
jgi:UDP-N-acetylmuramate dehydrogenase